ncbi:MAG: hypothetical protein CSB22_00570 [Deltaproteobacteria bacterium]|nr:MAG: hypothetical protein CSB22_00570 [Deltaproteobacteria bacterium]
MVDFMCRYKIFFVSGLIFLFLVKSAYSQTEFDNCIYQLVKTAPDIVTVGEIRKKCAAQRAGEKGRKPVFTSSPAAERFAADKSNVNKPRPRGLLPIKVMLISRLP